MLISREINREAKAATEGSYRGLVNLTCRIFKRKGCFHREVKHSSGETYTLGEKTWKEVESNDKGRRTI